MSRFNELLHGDLDTLSEALEHERDPITQTDTRLILTKLVNHLIRRHMDAHELEKRLERTECRLDHVDALAGGTSVLQRLLLATEAAVHGLEGRLDRLEAGRCPETADAALSDLEARLARLEAAYESRHPDFPL